MDTLSLKDYAALPPFAPSNAARYASVFEQLISALPTAVHPVERASLLKEIVEDVGREDYFSNELTLLALQAIKTLGRNPIGSEVLARPRSLRILLEHAHLPSTPTLTDAASETRPSISEKRPSFSLSRRGLGGPSPQSVGSPASSEVLRVLANCLLLHESARDELIRQGAGEGLARALALHDSPGKGKKALSDEMPAPTPDVVFILGRILFLMTAKSSPFITALVDDLSILSSLAHHIANPPEPAPQTDPTPELLKLSFNILLYYPRLSSSCIGLDSDGNYLTGIIGADEGRARIKASVGDWWDDQLNVLLEPLLQLLCRTPLPPSQVAPIPLPPNLALTLNSLLSFPTTPLASTYAPAPPSPRVDKISLLDRLTPSRTRSPTPPPVVIDMPKRLLELAERMTSPWETVLNPDDPTDSGLPNEVVESSVGVLFLVMARLCNGVEEIKTEICRTLLPEDLDRSPSSTPLEKRSTVLGRMIRLMASPRYAQTKIAVGEVFFALANKNASMMSELVGYGNAAGFLFAKGISAPEPAPSAPERPSASSSSSNDTRPAAPINPMTGLQPEGRPVHDETMTDEEKEREAERLFILFQRMEKNPAVSLGNPVREKLERGELETDDTEEIKRQLDQQDEEDERKAMAEMDRHRARKTKAASDA